MRRFCARPSAVSLEAIGLVSPNPAAVSRSGAMPASMSHSTTARARLAQFPVIVRIALMIGMAGNLQSGLGTAHQAVSNRLEPRFR